MKKDIENRADIERLVRIFYEKLLADDMLGHIFTEVAQIDLVEHLPILFDFWESVLFQVGKYSRNTMDIHLDLNMKYRLKGEHFNQWLILFYETVDEYFEGIKAQQAKERALSIANIIKIKIDRLERLRLEINN